MELNVCTYRHPKSNSKQVFVHGITLVKTQREKFLRWVYRTTSDSDHKYNGPGVILEVNDYRFINHFPIEKT